MPIPDAIASAFERVLASDPDRRLVLARRGTASAADLDALARRVEERLRAAAIAPGCAVGLVLPNGPLFLAVLLACRRAGHPAVLIGSDLSDAEIAACADGLRVAALVRGGDGWGDAGEFLLEARSVPTPALAGDTAIVKLTSGSAGRPRGVAVRSEALMADDEALRRCMGIAAADRIVAMVPFAHSYGLSSLVVPCLTRGQALVLPGIADPWGPLRVARDFEATVLPTIPAWIAAMPRLDAPPPLPPSLRLVVSAGAPLHPERARAFRQRFGRAVHAFYGATECGGIAYDADGTAAERGTVGSPIEGVEVDFEPVEGVEPGSGGRLLVRSPALGTAYVPSPDPGLGAAGFRTADLVLRHGDELRIVGRLDALIHLRGRKVDLQEIEREIARLEAVEDVVVHALAGGDPGHDGLRAVVSCPTASLTPDAVVAWCRERLAPFKVPRRVLVLGELPRTARGKVDRGAVARLGLDPGRTHA